MAERVVSLRMGGSPRRHHGVPSLRVSLLSRSPEPSLEKNKQGCVGFQNGKQTPKNWLGGNLLRLRPGGLCSKRDLHILMR